MALPDPRVGESIEFHIYPSISFEATLGDPEKIIWSSIKHLCSRDVANGILYRNYKISDRRRRVAVANNIKLYIEQVVEFYEAAQAAKSNTSPLFYYYSFLNLAKARCEIQHPRFHKKEENYRHGISWKPSREYLANIKTTEISLTTRGVWHVLWETLIGKRCRVRNLTNVRIADLFSFCPEISIEYQRTFGNESRIINLINPDVMFDENNSEIWIKFSVDRNEMKDQRISRPKFLKLITHNNSLYHQIRSENDDAWTFEFAKPKRFGPDDVLLKVVSNEIKAFNPFAHLMFEKLEYSVPIQTRLPIRLPQIMVLYTIMFWLGSLVRYDPHSVAALQDSEYWILIDGFMNQSRILLLELFEWEFYNTETTLRIAR